MLRAATFLLALLLPLSLVFAQAPQAGSQAEYDQDLKLAQAAIDKNDLKEAERLYQICLTNSTGRKDLTGQGNALGGLATAAYKGGDLHKALDLDQQALAIREKSGVLADIARSQSAVGEIYLDLGDLKNGTEYYKKSLAMREKIGDPLLVAKGLSDLAAAYRQTGELDKALEMNLKGLELRKKADDKTGLRIALSSVAVDYYYMGKFDQALKYAEETLAEDEKTGSADKISFSLNNLGAANYAIGRYDKALEYQLKALSMREKIDDPVNLARVLNGLGADYQTIGQFDKALEYSQRSLAIREKIANPEEIAQSSENIGNIYNSLGQYSKALEYMQRALAIREKVGDPFYLASSNGSVGDTYAVMGQPEKALPFHLKSVEGREKVGNPGQLGPALVNLGLNYWRLGQFDKALEVHQRALKVIEPLGEHEFLADIQHAIAVDYCAKNDAKTALDYLQKSLAVREKIGNLQSIGESLRSEGDALVMLQRFDDADKAYARATKTFEDLSGQVADPSELGAFESGNQGDLYARFARLRVKQNRNPEALEFADRGRAQGLAKQVALNERSLASVLSADDWKGLQADHHELIAASAKYRTINDQYEGAKDPLKGILRKELDAAKKGLTDAELKYDLKRDALFAKYPDFRLISGEQPASAPQIIQLGRRHPDTLYLEYAVLDDGVLVFTIDGAKALSVAELPLQQFDLERKVKDYKAAIQLDAAAEVRLGKELYGKLLAPVEKYLSDPMVKHIVIVAGGPLLDLPFACLPDASGKRLIERAAVSTAVSLGTFVWRDTSRDPTESLLVVADPTGAGSESLQDTTRGGFGPLPAAREEGRLISAAIKGSKALFGAAARESEVKKDMPSYAILHFACHGAVNSIQAMHSALVLAKDPDGSGFLEAEEIAGMPLSAQLAVLSACETAKGVESGGEGLMGLTWAFRAAGVPAVVASKWQVDDASTSRIMVRFYKELLAGARKDDAMRAAVLAEMQEQAKPGQPHHEQSSVYYWGAFQVIGDCSPLKPLPK